MYNRPCQPASPQHTPPTTTPPSATTTHTHTHTHPLTAQKPSNSVWPHPSSARCLLYIYIHIHTATTTPKHRGDTPVICKHGTSHSHKPAIHLQARNFAKFMRHQGTRSRLGVSPRQYVLRKFHTNRFSTQHRPPSSQAIHTCDPSACSSHLGLLI
jgi:hypothetical protein